MAPAMPREFVSGNSQSADHPDHCRSGPLESPHQSLEPGCGFVEALEHVGLAVLRTNETASRLPSG